MIAIPKFDLPRVPLPLYQFVGGVGGVTPHIYAQMVYGVRKWEVGEFTITRSVSDPDPEAGILARVMQTGQISSFDVVPMRAENEDGTGEVSDIPQGEEWRLFKTPDQELSREFPWVWIGNMTVTPLDYEDDYPDWEIQVRISPRWFQSENLIGSEEHYNEETEETTYTPFGSWWIRLLGEFAYATESAEWLSLSYIPAFIDAEESLWAPFKIQITGTYGPVLFENDQNPYSTPPVAGGNGTIEILGETFPTVFLGKPPYFMDPDGDRITDFSMTVTEWWSYGGKINTETGAPI
jgi:hypothetical protein